MMHKTTVEYNGIRINYSRDSLLSDYSLAVLKNRYMIDGETSPQQAFSRASVAFGEDLEHSQRMYDYVSKHWMMFSTPILANGGTQRGLPISCMLNYVPDSRQGLAEHYTENMWLTSMGAGIGGYWGDIRSSGTATSKGSESTGSLPFMHVVDSQMLAIAQGCTRRGAYAAYQDISHPEIKDFINMRKPTGGDKYIRNLNLHHGVNITDKFMEIIERCVDYPETSDGWELIDPHTKEVVEVVSANELWQSILETRLEIGEPFIHFIDRSNEARHPCHKELDLKIKQSNLCTEILLPTNEDRTAVCCLSSVNLEYYDIWKDTDMVQDIVLFLDNVLTYFIKNAPDTLDKAKYSAMRERSLGIGAMGFHAYLQQRGIPFECAMAVGINRNMFKFIRGRAEEATASIGFTKGDAPDINKSYRNKGAARRNVYLLAVAPNASSSILCGNTSPSIEPFSTNVIQQKTLNGTNSLRNKYLHAIINNKLQEKHYKSLLDIIERDYNSKSLEGKGTKEKYKTPVSICREIDKIWKEISSNQGSIQGMDFFSKEEQDVFKTAFELDQHWVVEQASKRQEFIDQGQSVNLFFPSDVRKPYLHNVHFDAWKKGLKTLYYIRTIAFNRADDINKKFDRYNYNTEGCLACE